MPDESEAKTDWRDHVVKNGEDVSIPFKGYSMTRLQKIWKRGFGPVEAFITDQRMKMLSDEGTDIVFLDSRTHRLRCVFYVPATVTRQLRVSISPYKGFVMPKTDEGEPDGEALLEMLSALVREITQDDRLVPTQQGVTEKGTVLFRYVFLEETDTQVPRSHDQ